MMKTRDILWRPALYFSVIALLFNITATAEIITPLFAPNINSGINWKAEPSDIRGLELLRTGKTSMGEIRIYRDKSDKLGYGTIKFNSVEYGFSKNDLIFVAYKASGTDNWTAFKKLAIENYGSGFMRHENDRYYNYFWIIKGYYVALEFDKISRSSVLLLVQA